MDLRPVLSENNGERAYLQHPKRFIYDDLNTLTASRGENKGY